MKVIYVSSLISNKKINEIINHSKKKPLQSIQKFHRLLCEGLIKNNTKVETISAIPMSSKISQKKIWIEKKEEENGIKYRYIPFINIIGIRQLCIFINIIFMIINIILNQKEDKIFICDILNTTIAYTTLILSKILKFKCIAIVTDLPENMGNKENLNKKINRFLQNRFDGYVLLTETMNEVMNTKKRPYIVIEGIADIKMNNVENSIQNKYNNKVCIYAGGLYEKYGVKMLIEAFLKINNKDIELHLYGSGELEEYIRNIKEEKIKFFGVVENEKIVKEELKATLLINPRFTDKEYTKYSFPSKNMEYMASGTPILTTKLLGIPEEYYQYIYMFEDETEEGFKAKIEEVLNYDRNILKKKGTKAKEFVMNQKNNIVQAKKIICFAKEKILK